MTTENRTQLYLTYLARDRDGVIIVFEARNYDDAIAICKQEGWLYIGWRDEDDDDED